MLTLHSADLVPVRGFGSVAVGTGPAPSPLPGSRRWSECATLSNLVTPILSAGRGLVSPERNSVPCLYAACARSASYPWTLSSRSAIGPALFESHAVKPPKDMGRAGQRMSSRMQARSASPFEWAARMVAFTSALRPVVQPGAPRRQAIPELMPQTLSRETLVGISCIAWLWVCSLADRTAVRRWRKILSGSAVARYFPGHPRPSIS